jgi:hypothetical protein
MPKPPDILVSSGFVSFGPKVVVNEIGAIGIGTIHGVHGVPKSKRIGLRNFLVSTNFEKQIIPHANTLKKIEVRQLNAALNRYSTEVNRNAARPL